MLFILIQLTTWYWGLTLEIACWRIHWDQHTVQIQLELGWDLNASISLEYSLPSQIVLVSHVLREMKNQQPKSSFFLKSTSTQRKNHDFSLGCDAWDSILLDCTNDVPSYTILFSIIVVSMFISQSLPQLHFFFFLVYSFYRPYTLYKITPKSGSNQLQRLIVIYVKSTLYLEPSARETSFFRVLILLIFSFQKISHHEN